MAMLGRLDIYYPDGRVEQSALTSDRITVGAAADNSIVLRGDSVAAYQFELSFESGDLYLINLDDTNGTLVAGVKIRDGKPVLLRDSAAIQVGNLRIIFCAGSDEPTVPLDSVSDSTQIAMSTFDVRLDRSRIAVFPASAASAKIIISNRIESEQRFEITFAGIPDDWTSLSQATASIHGGESHAVYLYITPPRRAEVSPADFLVTISVKSVSLTRREQSLSLTVGLGAFTGLSAAVNPSEIDGDDAFRLYLLNQGNASLPLRLSASSDDADLDISFTQDKAHLDAGQRLLIEGIATGRRPVAGYTRKTPIALLVQAENASRFLVALPATVTLRPRISGRALAAAAILIAVVLAFLIAIGTQRPAPVISSLALSASQVASGTPVTLRWQAEAADRYVIEVDRIAIAELPAETREYVFRTNQTVDPVEIALIAVQGHDSAIEKRELTIYQPVSIHSFSSSRGEMWRNVSERLVIDWQVEGAESLDIAIPEELEAIYDERSEDGGGKMVLTGAPTADFDLTLNAEDELGNGVERRIAIRILDPECTPIRDTPVFAGPDSRFQQSHIAIETVPVLVRGLNRDKNWLQVELANGESGWGFRGGFTCDSFDPDALVIVADVPRLPTETPTPTASSTETPTIPPAAGAFSAPESLTASATPPSLEAP